MDQEIELHDQAIDKGTNGIASEQRTVKKNRNGDNGQVLEAASEIEKKKK